MEFGMGFLLGATTGAAIGLIVVVIVGVSRKITAKADGGQNRGQPAAPATDPGRAAERGKTAKPSNDNKPGSGNTMIIDTSEIREGQLNKSLLDIKEMLLRLVDVVSRTNHASGEAAEAFASAKKIIDSVDLDNVEDMAEAQKTLLAEIDRVLRTNATLQSELDKANQGIETQRKQIDELRQAARLDGLTRIPNRTAFDERLREYVGLLDRTGLVFSLLLLDIDFFKRINDQFGHLNGDRILRGVAARITDSVRANDFAARYGGEEFAVIFPGAPIEEAMQVSERIRQDVAKTNFRLDGHNIKMTITGGLCQCCKGMNTDDVIGGADQALYRAKNEGRNRIERRVERNA